MLTLGILQFWPHTTNKGQGFLWKRGQWKLHAVYFTGTYHSERERRVSAMCIGTSGYSELP